MPKTHYTTQLDGVTFTRSTASRAYTHMVVGKYSIAEGRVQAEEGARQNWKTSRAYNECIAGGKQAVLVIAAADFHSSYGMLDANSRPTDKYLAYVAEREADQATYVAIAKAWLALGEEGHVAQRLARFDADQAKATNKSSDGLYNLCDMGWCSRLDLAQKLAATCKTSTFILEAVEVAKPVKTKK